MRRLRSLLRDEMGAALIETALVFPMLLLMTFGLLEFGYVFWEYHTAEKATAIATRYAVTRGPLLAQLTDGSHDCFAANPSTVAPGTPCSDAAIPAASPITCTVAGAGGCDSTVLAAMVTQMQQIAPFVTSGNVQVTLAQSKMGFIGRGAAIPLITVQTTGLTYNFVTIGGLLGVGPITMPSFATTLVGEDQKEGPAT
jgi:Flp pilus assembly protein TadG